MAKLNSAHHILLGLYLLSTMQSTISKDIDVSCVNYYSSLNGTRVTQSSVFSDNSTYSAEKAVDGNPNTCSKTSVDGNSWWKLDLGKEMNISLVRIKNFAERPLKLFIIVTRPGSSFTCGHRHVLGAGETRIIRCNPVRRGNIITIRSDLKNQSLSLCEVQVFDGKDTVTKGVNYEAWYEIPAENDTLYFSSLESLYNYEKFKNIKTDSEGVFPYFDTPRNIANHYGMQLITYYNAPESGEYVFYMSGDDSCRLFLSNTTLSKPRNIEIAKIPRKKKHVPHWTKYDQWNESWSEPEFFEKDQVYKITALLKEGTGPDHLRVGVRLPSGRYERPLKNRLYTSLEAAQTRSKNICEKTIPTTIITKQPEVQPKPVENNSIKIEAAFESFHKNGTSGEKKLEILDKIEEFGIDKAKSLDLGNKSSVSFVVQDDNFVLAAVALNLDKFSGFACSGSLPTSSLFNGGDIIFPDTLFGSKKGLHAAYLVCMTYNPLKMMSQKTGNKANSLGNNILSAVIEPSVTDKFDKPVELVFNNTGNVGKTKGECVFWIEDENSATHAKYGRWSNEGCSLVHQNDSHVVCQCNHLTKFAVLFPVAEGSEEDERKIELITYVGLALSSIGCFVTFVTYLMLRINKTLKTIVHLNLVVALGLADIVFLLGNLIENNKTACFVATILTFYLYLAVFGWMLVEGIHLYFLVIRVFGRDETRRKKLYFAIGWGIPFVIVVVTAALMGHDVMAKKHCWLSVDNRALWAFIGPVVFVIIVNIVILFAVLRTTLTILRRDPGHRKEKSAMRTLAMLVPILGITWVFGVITFAHDSIIIQYIFAALNAFQGFFIFILYCLLNNEVRQEYNRKMNIWKTGREIESKRSKQNNSLISG